MALRLLVVGALLVGFVAARVAYARWRAGLQHEVRPHPRVPERLLGGSERTWVVFTTPLCASCEPVVATLHRAEPGARVVKVDATHDVALADAFHVRSAPTVVLADAAGDVQARLVGARAVRDYVAALAG